MALAMIPLQNRTLSTSRPKMALAEDHVASPLTVKGPAVIEKFEVSDKMSYIMLFKQLDPTSAILDSGQSLGLT